MLHPNVRRTWWDHLAPSCKNTSKACAEQVWLDKFIAQWWYLLELKEEWKVGLQNGWIEKHDKLGFHPCFKDMVKPGVFKWCSKLPSDEATSRIQSVVTTFLTAPGFCWIFPVCQYSLISQHRVWWIIWIIFKAYIISSVSFVSTNFWQVVSCKSISSFPAKQRAKTVERTKIRWEQSTPFSTHDIKSDCRY